MSHSLSRPTPDEYADFYAGYVNGVPDGDIVERMRTEHERTMGLLGGLTPEQASHRYAEGKWSVKEVVGHLNDAERIFSYRALAIARKDRTPLPGMDQDDYVRASNADTRDFRSLLDELAGVRHATLALFESFDDTAWAERGTASGCTFSVRALAYVVVGHEVHHRGILETRYFGEA